MRVLFLALITNFFSHITFGATSQHYVESSQEERNNRYLSIAKSYSGDEINQQREILRLFDVGIDVNYNNPLLVAIERNNYNFIYAMTEIYTKTEKQYSSLEPSEIDKWNELRKSFDINATNEKGQSALILLIKKNHWNVISRLVKGSLEDNGSYLKVNYKEPLRIDHQDNKGNTALIWIMKTRTWDRAGVSSGISSSLEILLQGEADPNIANNENKTIFDFQPGCFCCRGDLYNNQWNPTFNKLREERG